MSLYPTPEQQLDPPDGLPRTDWSAIFRCYLGEPETQVVVMCDVTCNDEIVPDSLEVFLPQTAPSDKRDVRITPFMNGTHRADIERHFERHFDLIQTRNT